jgi:hypothetical protein
VLIFHLEVKGIENYSQAGKHVILIANLISFWKKEGLSELSLPKVLCLLDSLPLLGAGKVDYKALPSVRVK